MKNFLVVLDQGARHFFKNLGMSRFSYGTKHLDTVKAISHNHRLVDCLPLRQSKTRAFPLHIAMNSRHILALLCHLAREQQVYTMK